MGEIPKRENVVLIKLFDLIVGKRSSGKPGAAALDLGVPMSCYPFCNIIP